MDTMKRINRSVMTVLPKKEYGLARNSTLQKTVECLKHSKKELEELNKYIKSWCDLPIDTKRSVAAKICYNLIPKRLYSALPSGFIKFMAEEYDILELIERLMRLNVNNVQDALRELASCAIEKRQMLDILAEDLEKARSENWNAQELQQYIAEKADIQVYSEISQLLDDEFQAIPAAEKETRKDGLLNQLVANIAVGEQFMQTLGKVCSAGIDIFHQGVSQYYNYLHFYKPVSVIRNAAKTLVDMNSSMYAAKDALVATFTCSLRAIEAAHDAAQMVEQYSIVAPDMAAMLEAGYKRLSDKLSSLDNAKSKNQLSLVSPAKKDL